VLPRRLADADIDEAPLGAFAADLVAEEFGAGGDADGEVEGERLADSWGSSGWSSPDCRLWSTPGTGCSMTTRMAIRVWSGFMPPLAPP
jgi:hypothetical protein